MKYKLTITFFLLVVSSFAKIYVGTEASKLVPGADKIIVDEKRQTFSFVHFGTQPVSNNHNSFLKQILGGGNETSFHLYSTEKDILGWTNYRYYQLYKNFRIEGAVYYVHVKDGKIISANGEFYSGISANVTSTLSASSAISIAKSDLKSTHLAEDKSLDQPILVLFRDEQNQYHFCWKVDAWSLVPMQRYYFFVDANTGKIIGKNSRIGDSDSQGTAVTAYNGIRTITTDSTSPTNFRLFESGRNIFTFAPGFVDVTDNDNYWNNTANLDNYATDAHWAAEKTHDFYLDSLGRWGQDGLGLQCDIEVHEGLYAGAHWTGAYVGLGDGDGMQTNPWTSMDIVAHEYTHGVNQYTANLVYSGEAGALDESFSDIVGNTMRFTYSPSVATWLFADQIVIPSSGGTPVRDMSNPNVYYCADTYGGLFWNNGDIVHFDSGVQNYWYYLLVTGGSGTNDIGNNFNVTGIGLSDAIRIAYRNLAVYLTPNSTFADAAIYARQAAEDLFGVCSNQAAQTSNAWYAVGVGSGFSPSVTSAFSVSPVVSCSSPATVSFTNNSSNSVSYQWDFGDASFSTAANPSHTYALPGNYNVTLIATGIGTCLGADTLTINSAVILNNVPGPLPASCIPQTTANCCGYGIRNVTFNTINWNSADGSEGYRDFTCSDSTLLVAGSSYPFFVSVNMSSTSGYDEENVCAWIDYDNDGVFNNTNERVYSDMNVSSSVHSGIIYTPTTATLYTRLRMRVISDKKSETITDACYSPLRGQVEDYMVYFIPNSLPPVAQFSSSQTTIPVGTTINFNDLSLNAPTSWHWTLTGGVPNSSTTQNPANVLYNTIGVYPVKLVATNGFGSDSIIQTTYVHVIDTASMCQLASTSSDSGFIYDSGGPNAIYGNNENCSFLIDPCGTNLELSFSQFSLENPYDSLYIYDGTNSSAPLIGAYNASFNLPPNAIPASGKLFLVFTSNASIAYGGFVAMWTSIPIPAPVATFTQTPAAPAAQTPVQFTDQSTNSPTSWSWNFGDLGTSTSQNPIHTYANPGTYTVTLIATNCNGSDTTTFVLTILPNGIEENFSTSDFSIYPNPAQNLLHVSFTTSSSECVKLELTDVTGKLIREIDPSAMKGKNNLSVSLEGIDDGIYFLSIYSNNTLTGTKKVVVAK